MSAFDGAREDWEMPSDADKRNKVIAGLEDAVAYAKGDQSRARVTTYYVQPEAAVTRLSPLGRRVVGATLIAAFVLLATIYVFSGWWVS